jgi:Glycosyltransferase family 87
MTRSGRRVFGTVRNRASIGGVIELTLLALLPMVLLYEATIGQAVGKRSAGWHYSIDFHHVWAAGKAVIHGASPYVSTKALLALPSDRIHEFVYPAPVAVAAVPLGALPYEIAAGIYTCALVIALGLALWLLDVRDWRCYGAAFLSLPVITAVSVGTLTPLLVLGAAAAWRWRDHRWFAATAVAALIVIKIFLWPVALWLYFTGRRTAGVLSIAIAGVASIAGWACISFDGFLQFPSLLNALSRSEAWTTYSPVALGQAVGLGERAAYAGVVVLGALVVFAASRVARKDPDAPLGLSLFISVGLLTSPIVWLHYMAVFLVPIAAARPRLSPRWFVPLGFWLTPFHHSEGRVWRIGVALGVSCAFVLIDVARFANFSGRFKTQIGQLGRHRILPASAAVRR